MYIVELINDGISTPIQNDKLKLRSGSVVEGINSIDSFSFTLFPSNSGFDSIHDFKTLVSVYSTTKKRYEFLGRVLHSNTSMDSSGLITKEVTCESYFGFFCDSVQPYVEEKNWTVLELIKHILNTHNYQVEEYKRFALGEVNVTGANDNVYIGIQRENTWKTIEEKLIKTLGGEIRFRVVNGIIYFDYLTEIGETKSTSIELSRNMKSITREIDPSAYVTRLIPLGAKLKMTDSEGKEVETEHRLDINSANDGKNYIDDEAAIEKYGIHVGFVEFDDVTDPQNLLVKGRNWLIENNKVKVKYSISALELSLLGLDIDSFDVHNYHPIENALLGIDDTARIIKKNVNVCEEYASTIEVGENFKTLSDIQQEQAASIGEIVNKVNKIEVNYTPRKDLQDEQTKLDELTSDYEVFKQNTEAGLGNIADIAAEIEDLNAKIDAGLGQSIIPNDADLNNIKTLGKYTGADIAGAKYLNCPLTSGTFLLTVEACGADNQIRQTIVSCSKYKPIRYVRFYYQLDWGEWFVGTTEEMVLFENPDGSSEAITLLYGAANYKYLEIYYTDNNGKGCGYTKVFSPNEKTIHLQLQEAASTVYIRQTEYVINGTSVTPNIETASYVRFSSAGAVTTSLGTNYIRIVKIIGIA